MILKCLLLLALFHRSRTDTNWPSYLLMFGFFIASILATDNLAWQVTYGPLGEPSPLGRPHNTAPQEEQLGYAVRMGGPMSAKGASTRRGAKPQWYVMGSYRTGRYRGRPTATSQ